MTDEEVIKLVEEKMEAAFQELLRAGNAAYMKALAECEPEWTGNKYPTYDSARKNL